MTVGVHVYVGEFGTYAIPFEVMAQAEAMSGEKSLSDRRTKGSKRLERWGREQDESVEIAALINADRKD